MDNYNIDNIPNEISDSSNFIDEDAPSIIKVIGVGGGGGNAVNYMYRQHIPYVNFVLCNTDRQALDKSPVQTKIVLGDEITHGRGAGNKPEIGRQCAEASQDEIRDLFKDQTEMVFITAGMGGGTGTGAAPVVARIAKESGMLTIGIVTVPFIFEGEKKILKALDGANEMKKHVDALLVINNENLIELYKDIDLFNAFEKADDTLANASRSISEIISENCYINVDFQDVKTTLKDSGTAIISTAYGEGEHRVVQAIHDALHSPLLKSHDLKTSKRLLLKFVCSKDGGKPIGMKEMAEIRQFTDQLPGSIDVKWGIGDDPALGEKVKVTVLASGFDVTLREDKSKPEGDIVFKADPADESEVLTQSRDSKKIIAEIYGQDKLTKQMREAAKNKYVVLEPTELDDHDIVDLLERTPSYNRTQRFYEELKALRNRHTETHLPAPKPKQDQNPDRRSPETITF